MSSSLHSPFYLMKIRTPSLLLPSPFQFSLPHTLFPLPIHTFPSLLSPPMVPSKEYLCIKNWQQPPLSLLNLPFALKAGSCKENDNRAPGGSIEQYYIASVCTSLISWVHCTEVWVDFKCSAFACCLKFPQIQNVENGFKKYFGSKKEIYPFKGPFSK